MLLLVILAVATFVCAAETHSVWTGLEDFEKVHEFYGPLSMVYGGPDNRFFKGFDSVHVIFVGELDGEKMVNGYAEVEAVGTHTVYQGNVKAGVMQGVDTEISRMNSGSSVEYYRGRFNGFDFDSCFYANSATSEWFVGKMSNGLFNDEDATYFGPLLKIYNGSFENYATESDFFDFEPIRFSTKKDKAIYHGPLTNGKVAGMGNLMVVHGKDTLLYSGQFEDAKAHGVGVLKVGDLYSYTGHFADGQIAGLGEVTSSRFSDMLTKNEYIPYESGNLSVKGIWAGITGLGEYLRATNENGKSVKLNIEEGELKNLGWFQSFGSWVAEKSLAKKIEQHHNAFQRFIAGSVIVNAGTCVSSVVFPASAPVTGPICGVGFFTIVGLETAELTVLTFRAIDQQCYSDDCIENTWKDYGKEQAFNAALLATPFAIGKIGKIVAPSLKTAIEASKEGKSIIEAFKESKYAKAIAASENAKAVEELERLPKIEMPRFREIDVVNDKLAFKQAVVDYTGKNFREGFVEFFIRLKTSGREDLIKGIWNSHKNFIKESGIRAGGVHKWLEAEKFMDYLVNPKWGKDGTFLAYAITKMVQRTGNVVFKNGGAHHVYDPARRKYVPGPNSKSFHNELGKKINGCSSEGCVFRAMREHAKKWLARDAYKEYEGIERAVLQ